jgi:hypothetical protein
MSDNEIESIVEWWGKPGEPPEGANVSQELEQAVRDILAAVEAGGSEEHECRCCGELYHCRDGSDPTPLCDTCAHGAVEKLSQRITEWEERWSKDASQSESECRARDRRIEELENSVCQLEAERDASWAWVEQAKGYMQHKDECGFRTRTSRMNVESGELEPSPRPCTCGLDALLSSTPKTDAKAGEHA